MSDPLTTAARGADSPAALALRFGPAALIVALAIAVYASGLLDRLDLAGLHASQAQLEGLVQAHPIYSAGVYLAAVAAGVALSLPVVLLLTLAGGALFGAFEGGLLAAAGATVGGVLVFLVARSAMGDVIFRLAGPRLDRLKAGANADAFALILSMRLIPMIPMWLINIGAAFVQTPLRVFAAATAIGSVPSSLIYATLGSGLETLLGDGEYSVAGLVLQPQVAGPLAALAGLGLAPVAWRLVRARRAGR